MLAGPWLAGAMVSWVIPITRTISNISVGPFPQDSFFMTIRGADSDVGDIHSLALRACIGDQMALSDSGLASK